jgi:ATP-independent RNA helicase DbpA
MDHLSRGSLQLDALATLVLDEADRMLDMGFFDDIAYVAKACPKAPDPAVLGHLPRRRGAPGAPVHAPAPGDRPGRQHAAKIRQRFYEVAPTSASTPWACCCATTGR